MSDYDSNDIPSDSENSISEQKNNKTISIHYKYKRYEKIPPEKMMQIKKISNKSKASFKKEYKNIDIDNMIPNISRKSELSSKINTKFTKLGEYKIISVFWDKINQKFYFIDDRAGIKVFVLQNFEKYSPEQYLNLSHINLKAKPNSIHVQDGDIWIASDLYLMQNETIKIQKKHWESGFDKNTDLFNFCEISNKLFYLRSQFEFTEILFKHNNRNNENRKDIKDKEDNKNNEDIQYSHFKILDSKTFNKILI